MRYSPEVMLDCVRWYAAYPQDRAAARTFFERAIDLHGVPQKLSIDKGGANTAAITSIQSDSGLSVEMRQSKYLNNIVGRDPRSVNRITRPILGFKNFWSARAIVAGQDTMHMVRKGRLGTIKDQTSSPVN